METNHPTPARSGARIHAFTACIFAGLLFTECNIARERPDTGGQHPRGWIDPKSADFHGTWLRANKDPLGDCQKCHGEDYAGGAVSVGCRSSGCHEKPEGPEWCGTCHGDGSGPLPRTGAHAKHAIYCAECHQVPAKVTAKGHIDGEVQVVFSGVALATGKKPVYDAAAKTCTDAYCHLTNTPEWKPQPDPTPCSTCHEEPPSNHVRFANVAKPGSCTPCHEQPPDPKHVNGKLDLDVTIACDTCHGHGPQGAPPPALDGSSDPTKRGAGAHRRHLDETLPDRIGKVVACERCHPVPKEMLSPGHLDTTAPADVVLGFGESYDVTAASCTNDCHWQKSPGPIWTDASGAARACDACHGFPPLFTREGTAHTLSQPTLSACVACHTYSPATHVDGHVDLVP
jgi:predicted CxxxxCH...CXXCH cytochrome family protein